MELEQPLQKLTEFEEFLSKKKKLTREDYRALSREDQKGLGKLVMERINTLKGEDHDAFVEKVIDSVADKTAFRNQMWEHNHANIAVMISKFIFDHDRLPTKNELAEQTKLSRQTIAKHLAEFAGSEFYQEERSKFKILADRVMAQVYQHACQGNVKAARLFFEITGTLGKTNTNNYYIQINNLHVDESVIKKLPQDAINEIEYIITKSIMRVQ